MKHLVHVDDYNIDILNCGNSQYIAQLHENTLIYGFTDMRVAGRLHEKCTNEHEEPRFYIIVVNLSLLPQKFRIMDPPNTGQG